MIIILIGPPGVGKGTQAQLIEKDFNIKQISTGDLLRNTVAEGADIGRELQQYILKGELVPDALMIKILKNHISEIDCKAGYLLDGFPRTNIQAQALLDADINVNLVIKIIAPFHILLERLAGRLTHVASGRSYHPVSNPPQVAGKDDVTGEDLIHREDDSVEAISHRIEIYNKKTEPLFQFYEDLSQNRNDLKFVSIDGTSEIDLIRNKLSHHISTAQSL